jgi:CHAT domain-containing protein
VRRSRASGALLLVASFLLPGCEASSASSSGRTPRDGRELLEALHALPVPDRAVEPRLSMPTRFRACDGPSRGAPAWRCVPTPDAPVAEVAALAARARARADAGDPAALQVLALTDLQWGDLAGKSLERSISWLGAAARSASSRADALGDLAAAHLVRARRDGDARELLAAIEASEDAIAHSPRHAPAHFNLALAMDQLGLRDQASAAWRSAGTLETDAAWRREAVERHRAAAAPVTDTVLTVDVAAAALSARAARSPASVREFGWRVLLPAWGAARIAGDDVRAESMLRKAEVAGAALVAAGGDGTLADAAHAIRALAPDDPARAALAGAHVEYARASDAYARVDYGAARQAFARAAAGGARSPSLVAWATLFQGASEILTGDRPSGERHLRLVVARADTVRAPTLAGRARWALGTTLLRAGQHDAGTRALHEAARLFARAREVESLAAVEAIDAEASFSVGDMAAGYAAALRSLAALRGRPDVVWRHNALYVLARAAEAEGLFRAAARIHDEDVALATRLGRPLDAAQAHVARARDRALLGDAPGAARDLAQARALVERVPASAALRHLVEADLRTAEATASLAHDPAHARVALDSAVRLFTAMRHPIGLMPALLARAELRLRAGEPREALPDLFALLDLFTARSADIHSAATRALLGDQLRTVFQRLVMWRLSEGRADDALALLERGRASLADARRAPSRFRTAPGARAIEYLLVGDTLVAWSVDERRVRVTRTAVDAQRVRGAIDRVHGALAIGADGAAVRRELALLFDLLIRPNLPALGSENTPLVVVPDGELARVPFAALLDTVARRYLVERHPLRVLPSLRDAMSDTAAAATSGAVPMRALLIADPAFDARALPGFERLRGAAAEVGAVAPRYPAHVRLTGAAATAPAITRALAAADVVHFAGHAVFDERHPARSHLVVAPAHAGDRGRLASDDIARLDLRRVRLVVLSACQTAQPDARGGAGLFGLTGAFRRAGAHAVVGSLWPVDDARTRALMVAFHDAYGTTRDGAAALRAAQRAMIRSADPALRAPASWAAFQYVGR